MICFIMGLVVGIVIMCALQVNKVKDYERKIDMLLGDNMDLLEELSDLKYGDNKHITK